MKTFLQLSFHLLIFLLMTVLHSLVQISVKAICHHLELQYIFEKADIIYHLLYSCEWLMKLMSLCQSVTACTNLDYIATVASLLAQACPLMFYIVLEYMCNLKENQCLFSLLGLPTSNVSKYLTINVSLNPNIHQATCCLQLLWVL